MWIHHNVMMIVLCVMTILHYFMMILHYVMMMQCQYLLIFHERIQKKKFGKGWGRAEGGGTQLKIFEEKYTIIFQTV